MIRFFLPLLFALLLLLVSLMFHIGREEAWLGVVRNRVQIGLHDTLRLLDVWMRPKCLISTLRILILLNPLHLLGSMHLRICQLFFVIGFSRVSYCSYFGTCLVAANHDHTWHLLKSLKTRFARRGIRLVTGIRRIIARWLLRSYCTDLCISYLLVVWSDRGDFDYSLGG